VLLCVYPSPFIILFSGIVGNEVVRSADILVSVVLGTHFGKCCVITVLWDATLLTFVGRAD